MSATTRLATDAPAMLQVTDLRVRADRGHGEVVPVDGLTFAVQPGQCLGLVGESGSGKSLTLKAVCGLLPRHTEATGRIELAPRPGAEPEPFDPGRNRGRGVAVVFQEPMTALNPTMRVGDLIAEGFRVHAGLRRGPARSRAVDLMREVGIADPVRRADAWPHELSGGLRQRVMIAMALSAEPRVLLCDEPTTALDVTVQDQILHLLDRLRVQRGLAMVFVTHDLAVVSQIAQRVAVMYAGGIVETGPTAEVFASPRHAYTRGLLDSVPDPDRSTRRALISIPGAPPDPSAFPAGCRFAPRCPLSDTACVAERPSLTPVLPGRMSACVHADRVTR